MPLAVVVPADFRVPCRRLHIPQHKVGVEMRRFIGGTVGRFVYERDVAIYVDDDGAQLELPPNSRASSYLNGALERRAGGRSGNSVTCRGDVLVVGLHSAGTAQELIIDVPSRVLRFFGLSTPAVDRGVAGEESVPSWGPTADHRDGRRSSAARESERHDARARRELHREAFVLTVTAHLQQLDELLRTNVDAYCDLLSTSFEFHGFDQWEVHYDPDDGWSALPLKLEPELGELYPSDEEEERLEDAEARAEEVARWLCDVDDKANPYWVTGDFTPLALNAGAQLLDPTEPVVQVDAPGRLSDTVRSRLDAEKERIGADLARETLASVAKRGPGADGVLHPEAACSLLVQLIDYGHSVAADSVGTYSPADWLSILRHFPAWSVGGERGVVSEVFPAEVWTSASSTTTSTLAPDMDGMSDPAFQLEPVLTLVAWSEKVAELHRLFKSCSKGARLAVSNVGDLVPVMDDKLRASIDLYEQRMDDERFVEPIVTARTGLRLFEDVHALEAPLALVARSRVPRELPIERRTHDGEPHALTMGYWTFAERSADPSYELLDLLTQRKGASPQQWSDWTALVLLAQASHLVLRTDRDCKVSVSSYGFYYTDEDWLIATLGEVLDITRTRWSRVHPAGLTGAVEIVHQLESMRPEGWPALSGVALRKTPGGFIVDLAAVAELLDKRFAAVWPMDGDLRNVQTKTFERDVQRVIDDSDWSPPSELRRIRRRKLKTTAGTDITDIDAIAVQGDVALLIDCKAHLYTAEHFYGTYNKVRNTATALASEVHKWRKQVDVLSGNPVGRNYDLSTYPSLIPVTCTPYPCYVTTPLPTMQVTPGLRAASSLAELMRFLQRSNPLR